MLRPWELNMDVARESGTSIHMQIAHKIIEEIQRGRFSPGAALPGTREFASRIKVNRKTVIQAYDELIAQGWLTSESKRGTFVSTRVLTINNSGLSIAPIRQFPAKPLLNDHVTPMLSKRQTHDFIHFSDGLPDARLIPFEMLSRAMRHALITSARNNKLGYGDPKGAIILREALAHMLNMQRGLHAKTENICVVRGSQMGIFVIAKTFITAGDFVAVEQLGNPLARETIKNCGANILSVSHDAEGIDVDDLELLCIKQKVSAVYVTPHHHIPTTVTMSLPRRIKLLALAEQYDFLIIEDDNDHEFNFSRSPALPIASMPNSKRVIYIGSLSKVLTPSLRLGYIVAPEEIIHLCANQVMLIDRQGNQITELAVAELLHTGEIKRHLLRMLKIYEERRSYLFNLLHKELGEYLSFDLAESGLAFWLKIDACINIQELIKEAEFQKVRFQVGRLYSHQENQVSAIRMGFANLNNAELAQGVSRLKSAFIRQHINLLSA
jgi:GntR family transcriptional regulator/MocR family aminotransferase